MANITGSGKYIKIERGTVTFGSKSGNTETNYGSVYAFTTGAADGIQSNIKKLALTGVDEVSVGYQRGYTGVIPMCTYFYTDWQWLFYDEDEDPPYMTCTFTNYQFVNGFMVGRA